MGRRVPTDKDRDPTLYQMRIFAPEEVTAKSRFWYFTKKLKKIKKTAGEICYCGVVSCSKGGRLEMHLLPCFFLVETFTGFCHWLRHILSVQIVMFGSATPPGQLFPSVLARTIADHIYTVGVHYVEPPI